jgi:hypothetical protein
MKPSPPAPLTEEDFWIWQRFHSRGWKVRHWVHRMFDADRRDADLMLQAQEIARFGSAGIQLYGIDFRGWDVGWELMPGTRIP